MCPLLSCDEHNSAGCNSWPQTCLFTCVCVCVAQWSVEPPRLRSERPAPGLPWPDNLEGYADGRPASTSCRPASAHPGARIHPKHSARGSMMSGLDDECNERRVCKGSGAQGEAGMATHPLTRPRSHSTSSGARYLCVPQTVFMSCFLSKARERPKSTILISASSLPSESKTCRREGRGGEGRGGEGLGGAPREPR